VRDAVGKRRPLDQFHDEGFGTVGFFQAIDRGDVDFSRLSVEATLSQWIVICSCDATHSACRPMCTWRSLG
jgi:hypothetical protein